MIQPIRKAFEGDDDILKYADPSETYDDIEALCKRIEEKLVEHSKTYPCKFITVERDNEVVGYFFYRVSPVTLISFGINKNYRKDNNFFAEIKRELGRDFDCYVFSRNERALKWLYKNGMKVLFQSDLITFLESPQNL